MLGDEPCTVFELYFTIDCAAACPVLYIEGSLCITWAIVSISRAKSPIQMKYFNEFQMKDRNFRGLLLIGYPIIIYSYHRLIWKNGKCC